MKSIMPRLKNLNLKAQALLVILCILTFGCSSHTVKDIRWESPLSSNHPLVGKLVRTSDLQVIPSEQLINEISQANYILIGEKHDNPDHHKIQRWLLERLLAKRKFQIVFEMLNHEQTTDNITPSVSDQELSQILAFEQRGWTDSFYLPLVKTGLSHNTQITGGNLPKSQMMDIYRSGTKPIMEKPRFLSFDSINQEQRASIKDEIYQQHCQLMTMEQTAPMADIQIAKDASLAFSMTNHVVTNQVTDSILIAGNYHTNKRVGVPVHLQHLSPNSVIKTVQIIEVSDKYQSAKELPQETIENTDYLWFTPRWTNKDYCEEMKNQIKHKKTEQ